MAENTIDETMDKVTEGQQARVIRSVTEEWLITQEESIVTKLINAHKTDTLTDSFLRGSIGEIAGLRDFRLFLEGKVRQGIAAAELVAGD